MSDVDTLARTMWGEARNQGVHGMQAIANVVMNRVALANSHPHFGDGSPTSACLAPWQFSCWNSTDPNLEQLRSVTETDQIFSDCLKISENAVNKTLLDITNGATYYYVYNSPEPAWAVSKQPCAVIGQHLFFKDIS